jgi:anaerobic selenocysteine-containing dehydrogenase
MDLSRRDFLRFSAVSAAMAAAGMADPSDLTAANTQTIPVGQCRYCAIGCTTVADAEVDSAGKVVKILAIKGDLKSPVNRGVLCTKAFYLHKALLYPERPKTPLIRKEWINPATGKPDLTRSSRVLEGKTSKDPHGSHPSEKDLRENFAPVSWEDALDFVTSAMEKCDREFGKFAIGYYGSGQAGTEESHIMNKVLKGGYANNHIEGQPRMCMASAVVGYLHTFGKDEPYGSLDDLDVPDPDFGVHADTFFLIGNNTAEAHPILFNRIAALKSKQPEKIKVILADPRKTRSGTIADLWLPFASGRDLALLNSLAYIIACELDGARADVEKGTVQAQWKYLDKKFLMRHCNFAINEKTDKHWILTDYGGTRGKAWDLTYDRVAKFYPDTQKKYSTEEEVEKDWWRGLAIFLKFLEDYRPEKVAKVIFEGEAPLAYDRNSRTWKEIKPEEALRMTARWIAEGTTTTMWCMGVNQKLQGTWVNASLHMLHLITGKAIKPGRHSFSLTGQPNACGGIRAPGALCHALPYGRLVAVDLHRSAVEKIWKDRNRVYLQKKGVPGEEIEKELNKIKIHPKPGPHTVEMFRRYGAGQIKVMITSTVNPGQSLPYAWPYRQACAAAEKGTPWPLTVVLEAFPNATTQVADVVFPAASWYEKEFTFGNLERRYQLIKKVVDPPGNQVLPDSVIMAMIWRKMEDKGILPRGFISQFWPEEYDKDWLKRTAERANQKDWIAKFTENIWEEILTLSKGTGYDFAGMNRARMRAVNHGWRIPFPEEYDRDADVKARYDKYQSRIQYAYPYDPIIADRTQKYLAAMKEWNPVYGEWVAKKIEEMKADKEYHREQKLPAGYYVSFYGANAAIHGFAEIPGPDGKVAKKIPRIDGRALVWANPWWACAFDGKGFRKATEVKISERKFSAKKAYEGESMAPYEGMHTAKAQVIGNPEQDEPALLSITLSPPEFPGHKMSYTVDGREVVIVDVRDYKYGACTGRLIEQWHTGSMTNRVAELRRAVAKAYVEISSRLAGKLEIKDGDSVIVESPRGRIELPAKILDIRKATGGPREDYVFIPWFDEFKLINMIMRDNFDPFSFQADYKMFAVKIYKGKTKTEQAEPRPVVA